MATDQDFAAWVAFEIQAETGGDPTGALHRDPNDPGGTTKWGISQRAYPTLDVASLTRDGAEQIYYDDYWQGSGAAQLAPALAWAYADTAVNMSGPDRGYDVAKELLTASGGDVSTFLALRAQRYQQLAAGNPKLAGFLGGWLQRLEDLTQAMSPATIAGGAAVLVLIGVAIAIVAYYKRHP